MTIYISDFRRPLAERLAKDFFSDPSQAAVACVRTGPVAMKGVRWTWTPVFFAHQSLCVLARGDGLGKFTTHIPSLTRLSPSTF